MDAWFSAPSFDKRYFSSTFLAGVAVSTANCQQLLAPLVCHEVVVITVDFVPEKTALRPTSQLNEQLAFVAFLGIPDHRRISKLHGINTRLGNKSNPCNQNNVIPEMQWRSSVLLIATDDNAR